MSCNANNLWTRKAVLNLMVWSWLALFSQASVLAVQNVELTWTPSTNANVAGYLIYSGTQSRTYTAVLLVGNVTNTIITGLAEGTTNFFAAKAFDVATNESVFSEETSFAVPAIVTPPVVTKATATVSLGGLAQTYGGSARIASAVTTPNSLTVNFTYNGSAIAPTNAGNYTVIGTINDLNYQGGATNTLVISKAAATVNLGSLSQNYNGTSKSISNTTVPPGLTVVVTYNGLSSAPTNAGSYTVVGLTSDVNYFGSATNTLVVSKATATVSLDNLAQTYDGTGSGVGVTTVPPDLTAHVTYNGLANAPTNAGSYTVVGTISDLNYQGSATNTLLVRQAPATVTLSSLAQTYDGTARSATATTTPNGLTVNFAYDGSTNAPTNAGSYTVVGTVSDVNYFGGATNTLAITNTAPVVTNTPPVVTNTPPVIAPPTTNTPPVVTNTPPVIEPPITNPPPVVTNAPAAVNAPPTLNALTSLSLIRNSAAVTVNLSGITSGSTNENDALVVTAASGNPALISKVTVNYSSPNSTGKLTFKPAANAVGTAIITVKVNDGGASNNLVTQTFNVTVTTPPPRISPATLAAIPKISRQLTNAAALAGKNISLSVGVTGRSPFKYQWKCNGTNLTGTTSATLSLKNVKASQSGNYSVLVSNSAGFTNSLSASVVVYATPAADLTSTLQSNGSFSFNVAGVPGYKYVVQASSDMQNWSSVRTNTSPFTFVDTNCISFDLRYYRSYYLP